RATPRDAPARRETSLASSTCPALRSSCHSRIASVMVAPSSRIARSSPIPSSTSQSANGKARALEQRARLEQRQPDDARMAARNPRDQSLGAALDRIAAGLAVPFAAGEVGADFLSGQALEAHDRLAQPLAQRTVG